MICPRERGVPVRAQGVGVPAQRGVHGHAFGYREAGQSG